MLGRAPRGPATRWRCLPALVLDEVDAGSPSCRCRGTAPRPRQQPLAADRLDGELHHVHQRDRVREGARRALAQLAEQRVIEVGEHAQLAARALAEEALDERQRARSRSPPARSPPTNACPADQSSAYVRGRPSSDAGRLEDQRLHQADQRFRPASAEPAPARRTTSAAVRPPRTPTRSVERSKVWVSRKHAGARKPASSPAPRPSTTAAISASAACGTTDRVAAGGRRRAACPRRPGGGARVDGQVRRAGSGTARTPTSRVGHHEEEHQRRAAGRSGSRALPSREVSEAASTLARIA